MGVFGILFRICLKTWHTSQLRSDMSLGDAKKQVASVYYSRNNGKLNKMSVCLVFLVAKTARTCKQSVSVSSIIIN
jgi:hypothetical protein